MMILNTLALSTSGQKKTPARTTERFTDTINQLLLGSYGLGLDCEARVEGGWCKGERLTATEEQWLTSPNAQVLAVLDKERY